jgi:hypothetical protein
VESDGNIATKGASRGFEALRFDDEGFGNSRSKHSVIRWRRVTVSSPRVSDRPADATSDTDVI